MKHPVANISVEGQGWNPYAVVAEGKQALADRIIKDGHYLRGESGIPYTEDQRRQIAGVVYDRAVAFVDEAKASPAPVAAASNPAASDNTGTVDHIVTEQDLSASKDLAKSVKLGATLTIPAAAESSPDQLKAALLEAAKAK